MYHIYYMCAIYANIIYIKYVCTCIHIHVSEKLPKKIEYIDCRVEWESIQSLIWNRERIIQSKHRENIRIEFSWEFSRSDEIHDSTSTGKHSVYQVR